MKKILGYICFFAGLLTLLGLGQWQIERGAWKRDIISKLDKEYQKNADQYVLKPEDFILSEDGRFKVARGKVLGRFLEGKTTFWPKVHEGLYGYQLMDPFLLENDTIIMINRGWVRRKERTELPEKLYLPPFDRALEVIGVVREYETNYFTLDNEPATNQWRKFNVEQLEAYLDLEDILPTVLFAENIKDTKYIATGDITGTRIYPRNKHNQYAFFWFTLAALWIVIFGTNIFKKKY